MARLSASQIRENSRARSLQMNDNELKNYLVEEKQYPQQQTQEKEANFWQRSGETIGDFLGSIAKGLGKGIEGIIDAGAGIVGGVGGLFDKEFQEKTREFIETDYTQELYGKHIDEGTKNSYLNDNKVGEIIEGIGQGVGQMLPAVLATVATGGAGAASLATMGVSAAGNATEEAFNDGADYYKGLGYGAVSGAVEAATEKLTGGLTSNIFGKGLLDGASKSVAKEVGEQGIKRVLKGAAEEGFEEMVSEAVQPVTKAIYKGKDAFNNYNFGEHLKDIAEAGIIGAGTSLAYGGTVSPVLSKLGKGAVGAEADIVSSLESNAELENKLARLEYDNKLTEADEAVALKNTRTNFDNISKKLQKMGEEKRTKVIEKYALGQYFNADGSISENLSQSLEDRRLSVETNAEQNSPLASLSRASYSTHLRGQEGRIQETLTKASEQTGASITVYQGGFEGQSNKNFSSFKKALNAFSNKSGERLSFVVVNPNEKVNAFIDDNVVYIGADKISNNQWMTDVVHEGMHFNESSTEYKTLIDHLSKSGVRVAQANAQLLNRGYNMSDVNVYGSEMNAILAENMLGNEHFINKIVYEELSLGEKILAKIQNFKYMLETIKQQGSRAYRELVRAEKLYLKAIENYRKGVTHTWNREESNENVTPSNQGVESDGEVRYNRKVAKYIPYSKIGEENVHFIQRELYKLYQGYDNCVADGIAIENGNIVYIVDSGKENGEINFAFRKKLSFSNEELRKEYIRRTNNDSVSKGYISDGLSSKFRLGYDNDRGSSRGPKVREELSTNQGKPTNNQEGVLGEDGDRGVRPLKKRPQYSLKDSQGRTLTEAQAKFFTDSKVRDEQGNLLVVYHGSKNAGFTEFKTDLEGSYFTADRNYAEEYARGKDENVYSVYLNITKPFDTRNRNERRIFEEEFYGQWGNGAPLTDRGLLDWTDGGDMYDFIQEKGYDYDGIIIDEGSVPNGRGGLRDRGISYVAFNSNQIKLTTNENPTSNSDIRYSFKVGNEEMVVNGEQTPNLVALHNLSEDKLLRVLKLGGFPMPSIAITKADLPHENYGDITVVFDRETINPEADNRNVVYDRDAWTPTTPTVDIKLKTEAVDVLIKEFQESVQKYGAYSNDVKSFFTSRYKDNNGDYVLKEHDYNRTSLGDKAYSSAGILAVYLKSKGKDIEPVFVEKGFNVGWTSYTREEARQLLEKCGITKDTNRYNITPEEEAKILEKYIEANARSGFRLVKRFKPELDFNTFLERRKNEYKDESIYPLLYMAEDFYNESRPKDQYDSYATQVKLQAQVEDKEDFYDWIWDRVESTFEKKGIDNDSDIFDSRGNRRSFEQRHYAYTLNNIVRAMSKGSQEGVTGWATTAGSLAAKLSTQFDSIESIKEAKDYLKLVSEEELKEFNDKTYELYDEIVTAIAGSTEDFSTRRDDVGEILGACAQVRPLTLSNIIKTFNKETKGYSSLGYRFNTTIANKVMTLFELMSHVPTTYFEAKPRRAVEFNEIRQVLLPETASANLVKALGSKGISHVTYTKDNTRADIIKELENIRFSLKTALDSLKPYTADEIKSIEKNHSHRVVRSYAEIKNFIDTLEDTKRDRSIFIGKISDEVANRIYSETDIDVTNKSLVLNSSNLKHIFKRHGHNDEYLTGQIQINKENIESIIETLIAPEEIEKTFDKEYEGIIFKKNINGRITAVTILSRAKKALTLKTAWITKEKQHISSSTDDNPPAFTSETIRSMDVASIYNIPNSIENVNIQIKNPKYSLKSNIGLSEGEYRKIIANLKLDKKYSLNEANEIVRHLVKQISHENYYAEFQPKEWDEISHILWKGLNSEPKWYRRVVEEVADYLIEHAIIYDIYTDSLDALKEDAQMTLDVLKPYLHSLDLRSLKGEIAHSGEKHLYLRWSAGKNNNGIKVDELPAMLENAGIYIEEYNPADILFSIDELYNEANQAVAQKEPTYKLYDVLDSGELKSLKQSLMRETFFGFKFYGEETDFAKLKKKHQAKIAKLKEELREAMFAAKLKGRISYAAQKITDKKLETFHNATQASDDTFKKSVGILSKLDYRGAFNESARNAVQTLAKWYVKENPLLTNEFEPAASIFDQTIADAIDLVSSGKGKLTIDELKALEIIVRYFNGFLDTYNKTILNGRWVDVLETTTNFYNIAENNGFLRAGKPGRLTTLGRKYTESFADPAHNARAADMYDENGFNTTMFNEFRQGEKKAAIEEMHILSELEEFYKNNKKWTKEATTRKVTYLSQEIPLLEALSLYMSLNREQAVAGLLENGFVYKVSEKGHEHRYEINGLSEVAEDKMWQAQALRESIKQQLDAQDLQFLDIAWRIFNEKCKKLKYDTDMKLFFYSNVVEGDYFPIKRDGIAYSIEQNFMEEMSLSSLSFNKDTIKGAKGRLFIEPITEVINRHVKGVCQYAHLKAPIDTYNKVYSMDVGDNKNKPKNLRSLLPNQKNGMDEYFKKLISDIKGIKIVGETTFNKALGNIRSGFVKFQLGLNLKVLVTQLSSFGASISIINPANIIKGININASDVDKYCALAELRNNENTIVRAQGVIDKIGDFGNMLMKPIGMIDRFVVQRLYAACQYEVASQNSGAKVGTEENKVEAGKLLEKVIFETQQNSMVTERSQAMRSHSEIMKALTMFSSDAMKVIGRVLDGFGEISALKARMRVASNKSKIGLEAKLKAAQKKTLRSIAALVSTAVFMACVAQAFKSLYRKDEDKNALEAMAFDAIGNLLGGLPIIKDIYAYLLEGYDINNYAYNSLNSLLESTSDIIDTSAKVISGTATTQQIASGTRAMIYAVGQLTGLPVRNLYNTVYGLINRFDRATAYKIDNLFYNKAYSADLHKAVEKGDERLVATISGIMLNENIGAVTDKASREELNRLVVAGYNVLPRSIQESVVIDGEETIVTNKHKKAFEKVYSIAHEVLASLLKLPQYNDASDEVKAKAIKFVYDTYYDVALQDALSVEVDNKNVLFAEAIDLEKLAIIIATARSLTADKDNKGNSISGSKKIKVQKYINALKLTAAQKYMIMGYLGYTNTNGESKVKAYISKLGGLSKTEKEALYKYSGYAA